MGGEVNIAILEISKEYWMVLAGNLMPVMPSEIKVKVSGKNETVNLINGEQINILKSPDLAEISFDLLMPYYKYPFVRVAQLKPPNYYINLFDELMKNKAPFDYIVSRSTPTGKGIYSTVLQVSLENYSYTESAENGLDVIVSVALKVYRYYAAKVLSVEAGQGETVTAVQGTPERQESRETPKYYTVKSGDTLWKISKDFLGDGSRYGEIASLNGISNPDLIYPGQQLKIEG